MRTEYNIYNPEAKIYTNKMLHDSRSFFFPNQLKPKQGNNGIEMQGATGTESECKKKKKTHQKIKKKQ